MWSLMGMKNVIRNWRKGDLCYKEVKHLAEWFLVFSGKQNIFVMNLNDYLRRFLRKKMSGVQSGFLLQFIVECKSLEMILTRNC